MLAEVNGSNFTDYIYSNGRMYARATSASPTDTFYYHQDHLGTTSLITDSSGNLVSNCNYAPFGQLLGCASTDAGNHYRFTGDEHDTESNTEHTLFRQLSSTQGRWLSPDPYLGSMDLGNPQSINRYSYVANSPLNAVDPTGLGTCLGPNGPYECDHFENKMPGTPEPGWWDLAFEGAPSGLSMWDVFCMVMGGCAPQQTPNTGGRSPSDPPPPKPPDNSTLGTCVPASVLAADATGGLETAYQLTQLAARLSGKTVGIGITGGYGLGIGGETFAVGTQGSGSFMIMSQSNGEAAIVGTSTFQAPAVMSGSYSGMSGGANAGVQLTVTSQTIQNFV